MKKIKLNITGKIIFLGSILFILFWFGESLIHTYIFGDASTVIQIFNPDRHELWMRLLVLILLTGFGLYCRSILLQTAKAERHLNALLDSAPNAIIVVDDFGEIVLVNNLAEKLFGYQRHELNGQKYEILIPEHYREAHQLKCDEYLEKPAVKRMGHEERGIVCQRKDGSDFPAEIDLCSIKTSNKYEYQHLVINIIRDITKRKKNYEIINLLLQIYKMIGQAKNFDEALQTALSSVCQTTGWDYGEAWVPLPDNSALISSPAHFGFTEKLEKFRTKSRNLTFPPSTGLPGRVWISRKPEWIKNVSAKPEKIYLRAKIASEAGLKAGLGIPIISNDQVLAVLVFYMFESKKADEFLVDIISTVALQLGSVLHRKKIEQSVRESEQRFRAVAETATDIIIIIDKDSKILFVNDAVESVFGHTRDELIGKSLIDIMPERYRERHILAFNEYLRTGKRHFDWRHVELPGLHKSGNEVPLEISYSDFIIEDQHFFTGFIRDITERKRAEEKIAEEKTFSDEVINSLPGIFYLINAEGKLIRWNKNTEKVTGYIYEEVISKRPKDLFADDDRELVENKIKEAFATGKSAAIAKLLTKDGKKIPYYFTGHRITRNNQPYIVGEALDISEQKQAEEALRHKDLEIRKAYVDVFSAVTGGKLVIMIPDEIYSSLGKPISGKYGISSEADLSNARNLLKKALEINFPELDRADDAIIAFSEALTNAIKHAGGGDYQVYKTDSTVQILIADKGPGIDFSVLPKATLLSGFSTKQSLGMGFSFMLELCDRVLLSTQPGNTTLVLELTKEQNAKTLKELRH